MGFRRILSALALAVFLAAAPARADCVGDCDGNGQVTVNEIITLVNIALGNGATCPDGVPAGTTVDIAVIIRAVGNALNGCPSNPPWFPSLMAFEHYDSVRTHLFQQARFDGMPSGHNQVAARTSSAIYPTGYNMVYLNPREVFLYGGGYGNIPNATGAFVAKVDPDTLQIIWYTQLTNTQQSGEWDYPGVVSILDDGFLYVIFGYRLAKLDPQDGSVIKLVELPIGDQAAPQDTSYNGFDAVPDGTLIAKTLYRPQGCPVQGPPAVFQCQAMGFPTPPPSIMISIDPGTLQVLSQVTLPAPVAGRPTTARFQGKDYVYMATPTTAIRYLVQDQQISPNPDPSWQPGNIYQSGQSLGSAVAVMNDWFVVQSNVNSSQANGDPTTTPLSVIVINEADATQQFFAQPFANLPVPADISAACGGCTSWAPMSVSVDPANNLIYTADSAPGAIGAVELTAQGLRPAWTAMQRTTEFLALIGPPGGRVLVATDMGAQVPLNNDTDAVVWRDAQTGDELARSEQLPAMTTGTMIQPYYFGKTFYMGLNQGNLIELIVRPVPAASR